MKSGWRAVPIGEAAYPIERPEEPIPGVTYRQIGVRLWGEGAYEREPIDGGLTKYKTLNRVELGDIIVNKIWARHGSVSVVLDGLGACYCSGEFPLFCTRPERLEPKWFYWITKTSWFWNSCDVQSRGTSGKNRIRPEKFLAIEIPLPPLDEQRRIVAKIERLAAKIEEARALRQQATAMVAGLLGRGIEACAHLSDYQWVPLQRILREPSRNGLSARPTDEPPGLPILRISAGTSRRDAVVDERDHKYLEVTEKEIKNYSLGPGDLLACRFNGNLHFVGFFSLFRGESRVPILYPDKLIRFRIDLGVALPEYVRFAMNSTPVRKSIELHCQTTAGNLGISARKLATVQLPVPEIEEQRRIVAYLDGLQAKVDRLKALQAQTRAELGALLPSILDRAFKGEL